MGPPWVPAERAATMEALRRHRGRYRWPNLLFGGLNDAMFGIVGHLLRRPFAFWRFVQVVAPGLTADGGALEYAMFCVGLCLFTSPFAFAFGAHGAAPALAAWLVRAPLQEKVGERKGCKERWSSNQ